MASKPSILIVSCSNTKPTSIIKLISKELPKEPLGKIVTHPWQLETKYYTVDLNLIGLEDDFDRNEEFNNNAEALIIHMDSNKETGLDDLKKYEALENDCDPDVKLLIANYCTTDTKITKARATEWCLKRGFEFIELYPMTIEAQDQDVIPEKIGVDRVIEALQAHVWSNLIMKDESSVSKVQSDSLSLPGVDDLLSNEASDDFTDLFSQLHMMKDSIQSMPMRDRRQCAEQIATAFWKAIGGDEEEIGDL